MLQSEIKPDEEICIKYEIIFVNFINYTSALFETTVPIFERFIHFMNIQFSAKEMEEKITKLNTPGLFRAFSIEPEKLKYLELYIKEIGKMQRGLTNFLRGNDDIYRHEESTHTENASITTLPPGSC
jgi:hypothetical protein